MTTVLVGTIIVMTLLGALASWMLKLASDDSSLRATATDWHLWAGGAGYGLAAILNIWLLRHLDLSVVLPATALTYLWTLVIARIFLGEALTLGKIAGVGLIVGGVICIGIG